MYISHISFSRFASDPEICPILVINKDFSKQSNLDSRTVEATRKPLADQSLRTASVCVRGLADVTIAATTSYPHLTTKPAQDAF